MNTGLIRVGTRLKFFLSYLIVMGGGLVGIDKFSENEKYAALEKVEKEGGWEERMDTYVSMGKWHYGKNDFLKARNFFKDAFSLAQKELGEEHGETIYILKMLGDALLCDQEHEEARMCYAQVLAACEKKPTDLSDYFTKKDIGAMYHCMADCAYVEKNYEEALSMCNKAASIYQQLDDEAGYELARAYLLAAYALAEVGKEIEVRDMLNQSLQATEHTKQDTREVRGDIYLFLADLADNTFDAWLNVRKALETYKKMSKKYARAMKCVFSAKRACLNSSQPATGS